MGPRSGGPLNEIQSNYPRRFFARNSSFFPAVLAVVVCIVFCVFRLVSMNRLFGYCSSLFEILIWSNSLSGWMYWSLKLSDKLCGQFLIVLKIFWWEIILVFNSVIFSSTIPRKKIIFWNTCIMIKFYKYCSINNIKTFTVSIKILPFLSFNIFPEVLIILSL